MTKRILILISMLACYGVSFAQNFSLAANESNTAAKTTSPVFARYSPKDRYVLIEEANAPGLKRKKNGATLTVLGGILFVGGVAVFSSAETKYYSAGYSTSGGSYKEGDPKAAVGTLLIAGGLGMAIPGIILWSKGSKRYKQYQQEKAVTLNVGFPVAKLAFKF